jgi:hypothetical protein
VKNIKEADNIFDDFARIFSCQDAISSRLPNTPRFVQQIGFRFIKWFMRVRRWLCVWRSLGTRRHCAEFSCSNATPFEYPPSIFELKCTS